MKKILLAFALLLTSCATTTETKTVVQQPEQSEQIKSSAVCDYKLDKNIGICIFVLAKQEDAEKIGLDSLHQIEKFCGSEDFKYTDVLTNQAGYYLYFKCKEVGLGL